MTTGGPQVRVRVRRIYDPPAATDGARILVDRVWPRGLRKDAAHIDEWCREIAPSTELRRWYGHSPGRFEEFARRYRDELRSSEREATLEHLRQLARDRPLTLLTATRDQEISQAAVLAGLIQGQIDGAENSPLS